MPNKQPVLMQQVLSAMPKFLSKYTLRHTRIRAERLNRAMLPIPRGFACKRTSFFLSSSSHLILKNN